MATLATETTRFTANRDDIRFAARTTLIMTVMVIAGFMTQWLFGRSTFTAPLRVHFHAVSFMGWVALFLTQSQLALRGDWRWHRTLGQIGVAWMALMLTSALIATVVMAREGRIPFFFTPQFLLIADPMTVFAFIGLTLAAVAMRKRTDWHVRLQIAALSAIMGPAFGRMLPMPLLIPYAFETAVATGMIFSVVGAVRDKRLYGRVHPAWMWGFGAVAATMLLIELIVYSPLGASIYKSATAGYPGASVPALEYPPMPGAPLNPAH